jgi:hypothetical protein
VFAACINHEGAQFAWIECVVVFTPSHGIFNLYRSFFQNEEGRDATKDRCKCGSINSEGIGIVSRGSVVQGRIGSKARTNLVGKNIISWMVQTLEVRWAETGYEEYSDGRFTSLQSALQLGHAVGLHMV